MFIVGTRKQGRYLLLWTGWTRKGGVDLAKRARKIWGASDTYSVPTGHFTPEALTEREMVAKAECDRGKRPYSSLPQNLESRSFSRNTCVGSLCAWLSRHARSGPFCLASRQYCTPTQGTRASDVESTLSRLCENSGANALPFQ